PAGASSGGVKVNMWGIDSAAFDFTVTNIASLVPAYGPIGTPVTINGAGFGAIAGTVKFNTATAIVAPGNWSDTTILTNVPDEAQSGAVSVSISGILNTWTGFKVTKITAIDREFGPVGLKVTISGEGFGPARGGNGVYFNSLPAAAEDYFLWSDDSIIVKVPAGASSGNIKVKIGDLYSNDKSFKVSTITSLLPDYGPDGTVVDINGTAFGATQGTGRVLYGGVSLSSSDIYSWSDTKIRVKVPAGSASSAFTIEVNGKATNQYNFFITKIDSIDKLKVTAGEVIKIYGSGFGPVKGNTRVLFDALNSAAVEAVVNQGNWNMNTVEVIVPYGAVSGNLRVEMNGITSQAYAYQALNISSLTPFAGTAGQEVTITGSGFGAFQAAGDTVKFGTTPVESNDYLGWTDTQIRVKVPPFAESGGVTVTAGGITSNGYLFNIVKVSSIAPNPLNTGIDITVSGSGFGTTPSAVSVKFNDITAGIVSELSNTSFKVKVPANTVNGNLRVTVNGITSNEISYKLLNVTTVTPAFAKRGDEITITGEGFGASQGVNSVKIGAFDLTVSVWSDTEIRGNVAAGTLPGYLRVVVNNVESNKVWFETQLNYNYTSQFGGTGAGDSQFNAAADIALDSAGNIWAADANNHRVQKFNSAGALLGWIGRDNTGGSGWHNPLSGKTSVSGSGNSEFDTVTGVAVDSTNNLYVVDSGNKKIKKFDSNGGYIKTFETQALSITTYSSPSKLAVDIDSNVYVSDSVTNKILRFTSDGSFEVEFGGTGNGSGLFNGISGIAISADKKIFIADTYNHRVQVFDANGIFITSWGGYGTGNGKFNAPAGITVDGASNVYVADTFNNRIQKFTPAGGYILSFGSSGAGNGQFNRPSGIAVNIVPNTSADTIFIADKNNNRGQKFFREN
ncbi:MAG TPA: IPT/TIG domain-containing protein, partial [Candidatus Wallbacteria bacterium]|nr:IPT/TIG domain-containing protein [Candidatus Wallbacteria bacterium]